MRHLIKAYEDKGGEIIPHVKVDKLTMEDGRAVGFTGTDIQNGDAISVRGDMSILTSGGFNSNIDMVLEVRPELGSRSWRGQDLAPMVTVIKWPNRLVVISPTWTTCGSTATPPRIRDQTGRRGLVYRHIPGYIWVNQQGKRFHNEALSGGTMSPAVLAQDPPYCWAIVDTPMKATLEIWTHIIVTGTKLSEQKLKNYYEFSLHKKADTLEELAQEIDVPSENLIGEISSYNKESQMGLIKNPPLASRLRCQNRSIPPPITRSVFQLRAKTLAGLKQTNNVVLNKHFEPIAGLFAAGEAWYGWRSY